MCTTCKSNGRFRNMRGFSTGWCAARRRTTCVSRVGIRTQRHVAGDVAARRREGRRDTHGRGSRNRDHGRVGRDVTGGGMLTHPATNAGTTRRTNGCSAERMPRNFTTSLFFATPRPATAPGVVRHAECGVNLVFVPFDEEAKHWAETIPFSRILTGQDAAGRFVHESSFPFLRSGPSVGTADPPPLALVSRVVGP